MNNLKNFNELNEDVEITQVQKDVKQEVKKMKPKTKNAYQQFFSDKLKKTGKTLGELGEERGQFFKEVGKEWTAHKKTLAKDNKIEENYMMNVKSFNEFINEGRLNVI